MSELVSVVLKFCLLVFGPMLTARWIASLRASWDELNDPVFKASCDEAYNQMRKHRGAFIADREMAAAQEDVPEGEPVLLPSGVQNQLPPVRPDK